MPTIVSTKNLSVIFGKNEALHDITFSLEPADILGLAGPNGAGKTTLIKAILGLIPVRSGDIFILDQPLNKFNDWGKVGYLPQKQSTINPIFPASVKEIVTLGLLAGKKFPKNIGPADLKKVENVLEKLRIIDLENKMLTELSGGQQQKVLLARALVNEPRLLIFDEPSTALDPDSREIFFQLIQKLNRENGITIILITHDTGYIGKYANKLLYLDKKQVYFGNFSDFCGSRDMGLYFTQAEQHLICHQHNDQ
jgi:zinc transport system ATP-binding protein